jgi:septum site-determining protein MinD
MARIITVTSGKGGVGKTTITANIGTALALMGKKVCLIDTDFGLRNLDIPLGLTNRIFFDFVDYINGQNLEKVLIRDKQLPNLSLIPGNKDSSAFDYPPLLFKKAITAIRNTNHFDYIIIDSSAGIEKGFQVAVSCADEIIVVTTPDKTAIQDADRVIGLIEKQTLSLPLLVINWYNEKTIKGHTLLSIEEITNTLNCPLLGVILKDEEIIKSVHNGKAIALNSHLESGIRFRHIARNLINNVRTPFVSIEGTKQKMTPISFSHKVLHYFNKRKHGDGSRVPFSK